MHVIIDDTVTGYTFDALLYSFGAHSISYMYDQITFLDLKII